MGDGKDAGIASTSDPGIPKALAFYVPSFHPIPQLDSRLGNGFTEWTLVNGARPLFPGHEQPHVPGELAYYDLRLPEVRQAQADLAAVHGISGFVYNHYWFNGSRPGGRPFAEVLATGEPALPFALNWANEPWTTGGVGRDGDVIISDEHGEEDDLAHIRWLAEAFADGRYITIDGRPLVLVSAPRLLPHPKATFEVWRTEAQRLGIPDPYLCYLERHGLPPRGPAAFGMDASVQHLPPTDVDDRVFLPIDGARGHRIIDYRSAMEAQLGRTPPSWRQFPSVTTGWDDTPWRPIGATIFDGATPEAYGDWLTRTIDRCTGVRAEENYLFLLSWNDWAHGSHLEPDQRFGRRWLEATRTALVPGRAAPGGEVTRVASPGQGPARGAVVAVHARPRHDEDDQAVARAVALVDYLLPDRSRTVVQFGPEPGRVRDHLDGHGFGSHAIGAVVDGVPSTSQRRDPRPPYVLPALSSVVEALDDLGPVGAFVVQHVLEFLPEPQLLLGSLSQWSLDHGLPALVVCVPNVSHFDVALRLLCGRWVPTRSGLLDCTTVRFFAEETLERMLERTGWVVVARDNVTAVRSDQHEALLTDALPVEMIGALRTLSQAENANAAVQTFVWALRPVPVHDRPVSYLDAVRTPDDALDPGPAGDLRSVTDYLDAAGLLASEANRRAVELAAVLDEFTDGAGPGNGKPGTAAWKDRLRREAAKSPRRAALLARAEHWVR